MRFQRLHLEDLRGYRVNQELVPLGPEAMSIFKREGGGGGIGRGRGLMLVKEMIKRNDEMVGKREGD